jgi:hypothetical protein
MYVGLLGSQGSLSQVPRHYCCLSRCTTIVWSRPPISVEFSRVGIQLVRRPDGGSCDGEPWKHWGSAMEPSATLDGRISDPTWDFPQGSQVLRSCAAVAWVKSRLISGKGMLLVRWTVMTQATFRLPLTSPVAQASLYLCIHNSWAIATLRARHSNARTASRNFSAAGIGWDDFSDKVISRLWTMIIGMRPPTLSPLHHRCSKESRVLGRSPNSVWSYRRVSCSVRVSHVRLTLLAFLGPYAGRNDLASSLRPALSTATRAEIVEPKAHCVMVEAESERAVYFRNSCDVGRESSVYLLANCSANG